MRVGIIALLQESNTFIAEPTTIDHFRQSTLLIGEAVREQLADTHHEVGGFFEGLEQAGIEAVPIFAARALPFGVMTKETLNELLEMMWAEFDRAGPLDGILAAPHGANVSERERDVDGYWLAQLRERIGADTPIIATLDPHANLSRRMVAATDAILAYRTNPHVDQRQRGLEAAKLMSRALAGEVRPTQAALFPPMAINIESQHPADPPCSLLYEAAEDIRREDGVLSVSIVLGFPYADVEEMGSSVVVVTDDDPALATESAARLGTRMWNMRDDLSGRFIGIEEALDRMENLAGPVCLLDMGDNVGGGSPADGTFLAHAIHDRRMSDAFVCLFDPDSVKQAEAAGVGQRVSLRVGGKTDGSHGSPLKAEFTVVSICDGQFEEPEVRHGGFSNFDQGRTAVVCTDYGLTLMLTSLRMLPFSLNQLISCGLDPRSFHILVAKGVHAPVAAYREVCDHLIRVDTPGITTADMTRLEYRHRRKPMFPFERTCEWKID